MKRILHPPLLVSLFALSLAACSSAGENPPDSQESVEKQIPEQVELSSNDPKRETNPDARVFILPAPSEIVAVLSLDQHSQDLRKAIGDQLISYSGLAQWQASIALGSSIADLMITIPTADNADISARLENISAGMSAIGVKGEMTAKLVDLQRKVAGGSVTRDRLVREFDRFRAAIIREGGDGIGEEKLALLAVGGWARAVNLVSNLMLKTGEVPIGADLLKLKIVVETLLSQVGSTPEAQPVAEALRRILPVTADKPEEPTPDEITVFVTNTGQILSLYKNG